MTRRNRTLITAGAVLAVAAFLFALALIFNFRGTRDATFSLFAPRTTAAIQAPAVTKDLDMKAETADNGTVIIIDGKSFVPATDLTLESGATYLVRTDAAGNHFVVLDNRLHKLLQVMALAPTAAPTPTAVALNLTNNMTPTSAMTQTVVVENALTHPMLFDGQSTGKEYTTHYDIGVNTAPRQIGIVFGRYAEWNTQTSGSLDKGCALVVLYQGWNGNLGIQDGRYEIYNLPAFGDYKQWGVKLANERAAEQAAHYGCPAKDITKGVANPSAADLAQEEKKRAEKHDF
jgi:hypothetical protein